MDNKDACPSYEDATKNPQPSQDDSPKQPKQPKQQQQQQQQQQPVSPQPQYSSGVKPKSIMFGSVQVVQTKKEAEKKPRMEWWRVYGNGLITSSPNKDGKSSRVKWVGKSRLHSVSVITVADAFGGNDNPNMRAIKLEGQKTTAWLIVPSATADQWQASLTVCCQCASSQNAKSHGSSDVIYEDSCVALYPDRVIVKWYYFPHAGSKTIPINAIREVYVPKLGLWNHKLWGMGMDFSVWWAFGLSVGGWMFEDEPRVVIDKGTYPRVGFSCKNIPILMTELERLLGSH